MYFSSCIGHNNLNRNIHVPLSLSPFLPPSLPLSLPLSLSLSLSLPLSLPPQASLEVREFLSLDSYDSFSHCSPHISHINHFYVYPISLKYDTQKNFPKVNYCTMIIVLIKCTCIMYIVLYVYFISLISYVLLGSQYCCEY